MPKRVLVVDDHPAVALALKVFLRSDGRYEVAAQRADRRRGARAARRPGRRPARSQPARHERVSSSCARSATRGPDAKLILHSAADDTPEVDAVRPLVDAVAAKSGFIEVLAALERLTGG